MLISQNTTVHQCHVCLQENRVESSEDEDEEVVDLEDIGGSAATANKQRKGTRAVSGTSAGDAATVGCEGEEMDGEGEEKGSGNTGGGAPREMVTPVLRQSLTKQGKLETC